MARKPEMMPLHEPSMSLKPIGVIRTPFRKREEAPRQGRLSQEVCVIVVDEEYAPGLEDLGECTHLIVLYWLHLADRTRLFAQPPGESREHGVFATRSPNRPNPVALDIVELLGVEGNRLTVRGMDALDGSVLLDIKPYSAGIDSIPGARIGWQREGQIGWQREGQTEGQREGAGAG